MLIDRNRRFAVAVSVAVLMASLSLFFAPSSATMTFLIIASASATLSFVLIAPEKEWRNGGAFRIFFIQGCTLTLALCPSLAVTALAWLLAPLPALLKSAYPNGRRESWKTTGAFFYYQTASSALFLVATLILTGNGGPFRGVPETGEQNALAAALFFAASWIRLGAFPFHASTLSLIEKAPGSAAIPILSSQMGLIGILRLAFPLGAQGLDAYAELFAWLPVIGALYFSMLAAVQTEPMRLCAWLSLATTSLGVSGLFVTPSPSAAGVAIQWFSASIVSAGLGGAGWLVRARVGKRSGGLAASLPALATFFLLFGLAGAGIPGALGFFSLDLITDSSFVRSATFGASLIVVSGLVLFAAYSGFAGIFLGPPSIRSGRLRMDVIGRERMGLLLLILALTIPTAFLGSIVKWTANRTEPFGHIHHASTRGKAWEQGIVSLKR